MVFEPEMRTCKGKGVVVEGEAEGLADGAGAVCESAVDFFLVAALEHGVDAGEGLEGADEDGMGCFGVVCDDVEEVVHAVAEVDVGDAAGLIHHFGAWGPPVAVGMARPVGSAGIRFGFGDDAAGEVAVDIGVEVFTEQLVGNRDDIFSMVEGERDYFLRRRLPWGRLFLDCVCNGLHFTSSSIRSMCSGMTESVSETLCMMPVSRP